MGLRQVVPPSTMPVTLAEARTACRIDHTEEDDLLSLYIAAALAVAERRCNVAFEPQTLELSLDSFPKGGAILPVGPVVSLDPIEYVDGAGVSQTIEGIVGADGVVRAEWPSGSLVRVRYAAGTGTPPDVKVAILLMVALYYDNRAEAGSAAMISIPFGAEMILRQHHRMFPEHVAEPWVTI